jgi:hypothetical protein
MAASTAVSYPRALASSAPSIFDWNWLRSPLEAALAQSGAQGAYLYRFEATETLASLAAWAGLPGSTEAVFTVGRGHHAAWQRRHHTPVVLHEDAWLDWRFRSLDEFARHRFEGVISVPAGTPGQIVGLANFCYKRRAPIAPRHVDRLLRLGPVLGALLEAPPGAEAAGGGVMPPEGVR